MYMGQGGTHAGGTHAGGYPRGGYPRGGYPRGGVPTRGVPTRGVPTRGVPTRGALYFYYSSMWLLLHDSCFFLEVPRIEELQDSSKSPPRVHKNLLRERGGGVPEGSSRTLGDPP